MSMVPVIEKKAEIVSNIFFHSLCVSLIVAVQVMHLASARQTEHGPYKNIQGVCEIRTKILNLPRYFCKRCFCCIVFGLWQCITKVLFNS
jgi:hypothetical protein